MRDELDYYHGSRTEIASIGDGGAFGGLFATCDRGAALSHGDVLYVIESPRPLSDYALNYEIEGSWDVAMQIARGDEAVAEAIMSRDCDMPDVDAEQSWELQRLRGALAARLGYTSVEMRDEHGTTWLCLPGCAISICAHTQKVTK